jgi:hypothetical protein
VTHVHLLDLMVRIVSEEYLRSMDESDFVSSSFETSGLLTFLGGETLEAILSSDVTCLRHLLTWHEPISS